jgi:hypothetical protein
MKIKFKKWISFNWQLSDDESVFKKPPDDDLCWWKHVVGYKRKAEY